MEKDKKIPELTAVANRLKVLRKEKGFKNYEHIAFELGMSRSAYWRLEQGHNFTMATLVKICRLLDVTLAEFFEGVETPNKSGKKKK